MMDPYLAAAGFLYRENDRSHSKTLSDTFSLEVDSDMNTYIVCTTDAIEIDIASFQIDPQMALLIASISCYTENVRTNAEPEAMRTNLKALLRIAH